MRRVLMLALVAALAIALYPMTADAQIGFNENHYRCYPILEHSGFQPFEVSLRDQFGGDDAALVQPRYLCNPVEKNDEPPPEPEIHQLCYEIVQFSSQLPRDLLVDNQFGNLKVRVQDPELLCVPSKKIELN